MSETIVEEAEAETTNETKVEAKEPTEIEALASEMGWAPQDEWRGDPDKWVDAKAFIKAGPEIYKSTLSRQDNEMSEMRKTFEEFKEFTTKSEERAYKRALKDLQQKQREAVAEGDTDTFDQVSKEIDELKEPEPKTEQKPNADNDPDFIQFQAENPWYGPDGDYKMTLEAEEIAKVVARSYQGKAFYDKIAEVIRKEFPDRFGNQKRREPARVEGGQDLKTAKGGKTYADLPPDAKAACDRFVKEGLIEQKDYVKEYFEDEE